MWGNPNNSRGRSPFILSSMAKSPQKVYDLPPTRRIVHDKPDRTREHEGRAHSRILHLPRLANRPLR
jgi:hypothetical protein